MPRTVSIMKEMSDYHVAGNESVGEYGVAVVFYGDCLFFEVFQAHFFDLFDVGDMLMIGLIGEIE
jgi:hypothetical protein